LNVPVVAVFGPTQPEWFGPRGPEDRVVIRPEFWCRPCFDYCIFDQPYCLRTISVEEVWGAIEGILHRTDASTPERMASLDGCEGVMDERCVRTNVEPKRVF